jgi:hypothetical protein
MVSDLDGVVRVREELAELVGSFDVAALLPTDAKRLVEETAMIARLSHTLQAEAAAKVAESGTWVGKGDRNKEDWLARTTGTTTGDAAGVFATGEALGSLPKVASAARRGALSPAQLKEVAGAASVAPDAEERLLLAAERGSLSELREACKRARAAADPDPEATHARIHANRSARKHTEVDGTQVITLRGTGAQLGPMWERARHEADRIFREARAEGRREPAEAYLLDAFDRLTRGGGARRPAAGADAKIIFRVDWDAFERGEAAPGELCELVGTGPVPVSAVRAAAREAFIAAVVAAGKDIRRVVHLGRRPTALQNTYLQWVNPTCVIRGCTRTARLEAHHVVEWATSHVTVADDLARGCEHHHDLLSAGWRLGPPDDEGKCQLLEPLGEGGNANRGPLDPVADAELIAEWAAATDAVRRRRTEPA